MTPSEIADWHDREAGFIDISARSRASHIQAAATIRELEARVNNQSEIIRRQAVSGVNTAERLKIATEALECVSSMVPHSLSTLNEVQRAATQALARIKEVG